MKPPVVFLDMDGVLASARAQAAVGPEEKNYWAVLDPLAIAFFNRYAGEVEWVCSSTWRKSFDRQAMTQILQAAGWRGRWHQVWCTPEGEKNRVEEIRAWLAAHIGARKFIVLDDAPELWPVEWDVVRTDPVEGMQTAHYAQFRSIMRRFAHEQ